MLDPEVVLRPETHAARRRGSFAEDVRADVVAQLMSGGAEAARLALVGGMPGVVWTPGGGVRGAIAFDIADGRIVEINVVANAEHLEQLDVVVLDG